MNPIQMQVATWARGTFPLETVPEKILHLWEEIEESFEAATGMSEMAMREITDSAMILMNTAYDLGVALPEPSPLLGEYVLAKLEVNKRRKWGRREDGVYHHVKESSS